MLRKAHVNHIFTQQTPATPNTIKFEGWSCWINDMKITLDPTKQIMLWILYDTMKHFIAHPDHFRMSNTGLILLTGMQLKWQWQAFLRCFGFGRLST